MPWHWGLLASYCLGFSSSLCERGTGINRQCHPKSCLMVSVKSFELLGKQTVQGGVVCSFGKGLALLPLQKQMPCATSRDLCTVLYRVVMFAVKQENEAFYVLLLFVIQVPKWGKKDTLVFWAVQVMENNLLSNPTEILLPDENILPLPFQQGSAVCK